MVLFSILDCLIDIDRMKYILIICENGDNSVDAIMNWLNYLSDVQIIRINHDDKIQISHISLMVGVPPTKCLLFKMC
jgi:hypothetical protein